MQASLLDALSDYGLVLDSAPVCDEQIHRVGTTRKPRSKNGWYIVYDGGKAAVFGNWENGDDYEYWSDGVQRSPVDRSAVQAKIDKLKRDRESTYKQKAHEAEEYTNNLPTQGFSPYLKRKKLYPNGALFDGETLVIPVYDAATSEVISYQKIYSDGGKYFMSGGRTKNGCFCIFPSRNISKDEQIIVCEGFATGASIYQATGIPTIVAFNAGNLKNVIESIPYRNITIAADNDATSTGEKAAQESGRPYVMPHHVGHDFSDVFLEYGAEAVKGYFTKPAASNQTTTLAAHGLVQEIADWITSTATRPQPILSLAAALSFVGMLKGHRIAGRTDLRTNMLILAMAPTGSGKEHPQACLRKLAQACNLGKRMMGEPVSGNGFLGSLEKAQRVGLMVMDEMGRYIGNLSHKNSGSYQREIIDYIIKTFSCANTVLYGREYSDSKKNPRIDVVNPHFCCFGSTVYERMKEACTSTDVVDGFLNRWIVFNIEGRVPRNNDAEAAVPPIELVQKIKEYSAKSITYNNYGDPQPAQVRFTPEAWDLFINYRAQIDKIVESSGYPIDRLYSRSAEHVEKIALILCDDEDILMNDVRKAIDIVNESNKAILQFTGLISENIYEKDYIKVREIIRENREIMHRDLVRKTQFVTGGDKRRNEIVASLLESHIISKREQGRTYIYKWLI